MSRKRAPRPPLPPACALCRPYAGRFRNYGTEEAPQMARCDCARGKALGLGARWGKKQRPARPRTTYDGKALASSNEED